MYYITGALRLHSLASAVQRNVDLWLVHTADADKTKLSCRRCEQAITQIIDYRCPCPACKSPAGLCDTSRRSSPCRAGPRRRSPDCTGVLQYQTSPYCYNINDDYNDDKINFYSHRVGKSFCSSGSVHFMSVVNTHQ